MSTGSASPRDLPDEPPRRLAQVVLGRLQVLVGQPDVVTEFVRRDLGDVEAAVEEVVVQRVRLTRALEADLVVGGGCSVGW